MTDEARFLLDLSAWARSGHPGVVEKWEELLVSDRLVCHPIFAIELLHNAINPRDYQELRNDLDQAFEWVWPDRDTAEIAVGLQQRLARSAVAGQRVKTPDLLISALAIQHRLGVVHYDADYDAIAARGGARFVSEWIAPRGSLETDGEKRDSTRKILRRSFGERMRQLVADTDLEVWPDLIEWLDEALRARGLEPPPRPDLGSSESSGPT